MPDLAAFYFGGHGFGGVVLPVLPIPPDGLSVTEEQFSAEDLAQHRISSGSHLLGLCLI